MIFIGGGGLLASIVISIVLTVIVNFVLYLMGFDNFIFGRR